VHYSFLQLIFPNEGTCYTRLDLSDRLNIMAVEFYDCAVVFIDMLGEIEFWSYKYLHFFFYLNG